MAGTPRIKIFMQNIQNLIFKMIFYYDNMKDSLGDK